MSSSKKQKLNEDLILQEKVDAALDTIELNYLFDSPEKRTRAQESIAFLRTEVKASTEAMSSVPKPLKFMRPHYDRIKEFYEASKQTDGNEAAQVRRHLADLLSVLSTTLPSAQPHMTDVGEIKETVEAAMDARHAGKGGELCNLSLNDAHVLTVERKELERHQLISGPDYVPVVRPSIQYRLEGNAAEDLLAYGHEYIRSLMMDLVAEFKDRDTFKDDDDSSDVELEPHFVGLGKYQTNEAVVEEILKMGRVIVESLFLAGSFIDACDLSLELRLVEELPELIKHYTKEQLSPLRVGEYLAQTAAYERTHLQQIRVFKAAFQVVLDARLYGDSLKLSLAAYSKCFIEKHEFQEFAVRIMHSTFSDEDDQRAKMARLQMMLNLTHANLHRAFSPDEIDTFLSAPEGATLSEEEAETLRGWLSFDSASKHFQLLIKELDLVDPKHPDDVYKTYLDNYSGMDNLDSAQKNLASSYVSGFVHAGFINDVIINPKEEAADSKTSWIHKNKEGPNMAAAAAAMGAMHLWDTDGEGFNAINPFMESSQKGLKGGAFIGMALVQAQANNPDFDVYLEQVRELFEEVEESEPEDEPMNEEKKDDDAPEEKAEDGAEKEGKEEEEKPKLGFAEETPATSDPAEETFTKWCALLGVGLAHTGKYHPEIKDILTDIALDENSDQKLAYMAALSLGLSHAASADPDVTESLGQIMMDLSMSETKIEADYDSIFLALGMALNYIGASSQAHTIKSVLDNLPNSPFRRGALILLEAVSDIGSCNVETIQRFLRVISDGADVDESEEESEAPEKDKEGEKDEEAQVNQEVDRRLAVLGIALVCMGDEVGQQMVLKYAESLIQFGDLHVVRTIPLALAMTFASNPQNMVMDLLSKMAHDTDAETALTAIISLGIVAAGTNNARAAKMFRSLALYYQKSTNALFLVRISQGLVHLGKGLLNLSPITLGGDGIRKTQISHLLVVCCLCLNINNHLLDGQNHLLLWHLVAAANPRMLMMLNFDTLEPEPINLRVGQKVSTVGVAGNPRGVTGFQTHTSPVILAQGEQAEIDRAHLETDPLENNETEEIKWETVTSSLEGIVLVRKAPLKVVEEEKTEA